MTRGMVIVETRVLPHFRNVLLNHYEHTRWPMTIFHGRSNGAFVKACASYWPDTKFELVSNEIISGADYNYVLTDKKFWELIPYDKVLIFQHDSMLLRSGIDQYLQYAFTGAPLYHMQFPSMNGGLSLRDRKAMLSILNNEAYHPAYGNEDIFFSNRINKDLLPTKEIAQTFSVETIFGYGSLGVHAIDKWLTPIQQSDILNQYK